jgi:hypothetical protein
MDTVTILRELWRLRLAVFGIGLLALLAGTAVVYKISFPPKLESRQHEVGIATMRILVDTPSSQIVEVAPKGSDSLGVRANLLASLMVDGDVKEAIARRAGLPPEKLVGISEAAAEPAPASEPPGPKSYVLTTRVLTNAGGDQLPLIEMEAQAPDRAAAARLGAAAVAGLGDYLDSTAALQEIKDADRLKVSGMGAPQARTALRGPSKIIALVVTIFVFVLGCAGALGFFAVAHAWRAASAGEDPRDWHVEDELGGAADDWLPPDPALVTPPAEADWRPDGAPPAEADWRPVASDEPWAKRA